MDILARLTLVALLLFGAFYQAQAKEPIGVAALVNNQVTATLTDNERHLRVGVDVFENELIKTSVNSKTQLIFNDETVLTLGPKSQLALDSMVYDPDDTSEKMVVSATLGVFRFISGTMPSANYEIRTPTALIGVRGTVFDLLVEANGATTAILRQGAIIVTNLLTGISQVIDIPGLASIVSGTSSPPSKPASPTPETKEKVKFVGVGSSFGGEVEDSTPTEVTDIVVPVQQEEVTHQPPAIGTHTTAQVP